MKTQRPMYTNSVGVCAGKQISENDSPIETRRMFSSFRFPFETACNAHFRPHYRAFQKRVRALPLFRVARSAVGLVSAEIVAIHQRLWKFRRPIKTLPELPPHPHPPPPDPYPSATMPASLGFMLFRFPLPGHPAGRDNSGHIVSRHKPVNQARVVFTPLERYLLRRKINLCLKYLNTCLLRAQSDFTSCTIRRRFTNKMARLVYVKNDEHCKSNEYFLVSARLKMSSQQDTLAKLKLILFEKTTVLNAKRMVLYVTIYSQFRQT